LGWTLFVLYLVGLFQLTTLFPGFSAPAPWGHDEVSFAHSGTGEALAFGLPLAAIVCFLWPERLMRRFSPRLPPHYDYLLTEGIWYTYGYAVLLLASALLMQLH
jgi:hypothetical protein